MTPFERGRAVMHANTARALDAVYTPAGGGPSMTVRMVINAPQGQAFGSIAGTVSGEVTKAAMGGIPPVKGGQFTLTDGRVLRVEEAEEDPQGIFYTFRFSTR